MFDKIADVFKDLDKNADPIEVSVPKEGSRTIRKRKAKEISIIDQVTKEIMKYGTKITLSIGSYRFEKS